MNDNSKMPLVGYGQRASLISFVSISMTASQYSSRSSCISAAGQTGRYIPSSCVRSRAVLINNHTLFRCVRAELAAVCMHACVHEVLVTGRTERERGGGVLLSFLKRERERGTDEPKAGRTSIELHCTRSTIYSCSRHVTQ
jgi:hypothetical protein